ncbi:AAA family ATPase [Pauljensenia sp. UMB3104]|uniref:AAA family ATPase n=1 Tax=Pauljensenia sp. UMB3104 TaxID=3046331 RepID=UPI002551A6CA|nr:AAA family ATPase [Pauljensenia sp. UMB3104]MDK7160000.1 AAA family ATPase [Pauljensenia sp. UMB3104]
MMTDSQYSWPRFFMELADKLLAFKDDRQALIATLQHVYAELGMDLPTLDSGGIPKDIDPFTVYGLFNRGLTDKKRRAVALGIGGALGVEAPLHDDFVGVPTLINFNATLYDQACRGDGDIERLWDLFTVALAYADRPTEQTGAAFCHAYDAVLKQRYASWNVTMGLFWVRPYAYVNLSKLDRWFLRLPDRMPPDVNAEVSQLASPPGAFAYLALRDRVLDAMSSGAYEYKTFPELSACAWRVSEQVNRENKQADKDKEEVTQAAALGDDGVQTVRYWLYAPGEGACKWDEFYKRGIMGLAWGEVGDLSSYATKQGLKAQMLQTYPENGTQKNDIHALWQFANEMKPGDVVFVKKGKAEIVGRGVVTGNYVYDAEGSDYPNIREVRWTHTGQWPVDERLPMKTLTDVTYKQVFVTLMESSFFDSEEAAAIEEMPVSLTEYSVEIFLEEVYMDRERYDAIVGLLKTKKNIIMQGAPGVGKTYAAKRLAYSMMGVKDVSRVKLIQFHQSYSYEDFIEGYRPSGAGFELVKGAFYSFCKKAADDEENAYFFIIDEINRGNLSKIFGELFMLIESDKRGNELQLLYSRELFSVPTNVHIIGMMNTADRSLAMLDYALRRRFAFVELSPAFDSDGFRDYCAGLDNSRFEALVREVESLNRAIAEDESLGEGFCIGHSYFCNMKRETCTDEALASIVEYELIPMLKEYWFDEPGKVREWSDRLRRSLR